MRYLLFLLLAVLLVTGLYTSVTQIQPGERGVVRRFGRILDDQPGPGLYIGLPWGMDRVDRIQVSRVRNVKVGVMPEELTDFTDAPTVGQLLTGDHNLVNVQAEVYYNVDQDELTRFALMQEKDSPLVTRVTETALAEWVAGRHIDEVLLRGKVLLPTFLVDKIRRRLEPYNLGVDISDASITFLSPPEQVKDAFDSVGRAQTEIRTRLYKADQEADRRLREAASTKYRLERLTAAYAKKQQFEAQAHNQTFEKRLQQFHAMSAAERDRYVKGVWLDTMAELFRDMRKQGRLDLIDHYLSGDGINITQIPRLPKN